MLSCRWGDETLKFGTKRVEKDQIFHRKEKIPTLTTLFHTKFQCSLLRQQDRIGVAEKQCEVTYNYQHLITNLSLNE